MIPISLSDTMTGEITDAKGTLTIETNKKDIPTGKENILYKIYDKFYDEKYRVEWYMLPEQAKSHRICDYIIGKDCTLDEII